MSDLFLTSPGLELGPADDGNSEKENNIIVTAGQVVGTLVKLTTGNEQRIKFRTNNVQGAFLLASEQISDIKIQYNEVLHFIKFDSYNYSIERSLDQVVITIEASHVKE